MLHGYRQILFWNIRLISEKIVTYIDILIKKWQTSNIKIDFKKKFENKQRLNPYGFYISGFMCNIM